MARLVLLALVLAMPLPLHALSCLPYTAANAAHDARESKDRFSVVYGLLSFAERRLPQVDWDNQQATPDLTILPAKVSGHGLSARGYDLDFSDEVSFEVRCLGPWCPSARSDIPSLMFLRHVDGGYVLETDACGGFLFQEPSGETLRDVFHCAVNGKGCPTHVIRR